MKYDTGVVKVFFGKFHYSGSDRSLSEPLIDRHPKMLSFKQGLEGKIDIPLTSPHR
ncbi:MAG: hypothetical protein GY797_36395 [Deltaproteobacteria bacterium]|nr:hypothetical protein [Deltaproteobacteria bacterium]